MKMVCETLHTVMLPTLRRRPMSGNRLPKRRRVGTTKNPNGERRLLVVYSVLLSTLSEGTTSRFSNVVYRTFDAPGCRLSFVLPLVSLKTQ